MTGERKRRPQPTLGFALNDVARMVRKLFEQKAKARGLDLTRAQWQVLAYLRMQDGIRQGALAEVLELEPISLSRIIDKLEVAGFVERRPDKKDRRSKRLFLLPEAYPMLKQLMVIGDACRAEMLAGISVADARKLMQLLLIMRGNLVRACGSEAVERDTQQDV